MQFDLVFDGGGAKGAVFVGPLQEFEARGYTPCRLVGTAAGAVTATLVAVGASRQGLHGHGVRDVLRAPGGVGERGPRGGVCLLLGASGGAARTRGR